MPGFNKALVAAALSAVLLSLLSSQAQEPVPEIRISESTGLPIVYPYHGMLLNHDLTVIQPTAENIAAVLTAFNTSLEETLTDTSKTRFSPIKADARQAFAGNPEGQLLAEASLTYWLIDNGSSQQQRSYYSVFKAVEAWAGLAPISSSRIRFSKLPAVTTELQGMGLDQFFAETPAAANYIETCRQSRVPIPPDWGSSQWILQGTLDGNYTFAGDPTNITQVFAYSDPNVPGACLALPRRDKDTNEIGLLGIICQSAETGKACFWDNIDKTTGQRLSGAAGEKFAITSIQDGSNVAENCTNCHRGYNVFLIHPGTALEVSDPFITDPAARYEPISGQPTWGNPAPLLNAGNAPCALCHEIPTFGGNNNTLPPFDSAFCKILEGVVDKTMPSIAKPAGWKTPAPKFAPHVNMFREICEGVAVAGGGSGG
ncbi:hypothetical protein EN858_22715 [Mesorhizobium sp. M4B.F.Ca.ET.215.01.1.1]|uniref:hypothetical protein n=4 Tax=Mesorhizobium TaxID=68287 RepID=UPI000FD5BE7F|nr:MULTISPECIES: hypothetical protein [unclassified Mesorhizobium]RUW24503.1 hypothetical protein EOA34_14785 [Mesorhizobium sp. M4B.F.Ca.ET.013.02.1.1]TGQ08529.1 hypothetical protein EN858_22715 [Mesorhizobium sp. M4B.F.Ca.ET.215.01.1.1]TGQ40894.1 hypothetical protein EN863_020890 [Mesorhizobium sp. M00.F.Ca.ET.220.01.1.1]TGR02085.1 hypothetical protein EN846_19575 [Mesorhizobium sp. M4B.F.Ca.ET.203.01.1.1]TGT45256.1 hypothetical protein EN812_08855 [Mesorhizobium sp. M4B.F.Ca.ET.169.01.1.1]